MSNIKRFVMAYIAVYALFSVGSIYIYRDSRSLFEGGLGEYLYFIFIVMVFLIFFHSRKRIQNKTLFVSNTVILILWIIILTYLQTYGWYVLN